MEPGKKRSETYLSTAVESTFDRIDSPQYLNFGDDIPEPTDSYFERKVEDITVKQPNSEKFQRLPNDLEDDSIEAVNTLQVNQPLIAFNSLSEGIVTSTPFRASGVVESNMPWNQAAKPEIKHYTKCRPFSFEERNKLMLQRKAQRMQTQLQAEKDARKFRATPVPKFLQKTKSKNNSNDPAAQLGILGRALQKNKSTELPPGWVPFKARSPTVLQRSPFKPNLPGQRNFQVEPFSLSSELRAKDRKAFDEQIKKKERFDEYMKGLREIAQKIQEDDEIKKMRIKMVPKAQPIKKFKPAPVLTAAKRPLTEPMTPIMIKRQRRC